MDKRWVEDETKNKRHDRVYFWEYLTELFLFMISKIKDIFLNITQIINSHEHLKINKKFLKIASTPARHQIQSIEPSFENLIRIFQVLRYLGQINSRFHDFLQSCHDQTRLKYIQR